MLLDPLEEEFDDLPAIAVEPSDRQSWKGKVVREEYERFVRLRVLVSNPPQRISVVLATGLAGEHDRLVADDARRVWSQTMPVERSHGDE